MSRVLDRGRMLVQLIRSGDTSGAVADVRSWMWSENQFSGLTSVFADHFEPERSDLDLRAEPLDDSLAEVVFDFDGLSARDATYLERRRRIRVAGFDNGFVTLTPGQSVGLRPVADPTQPE